MITDIATVVTAIGVIGAVLGLRQNYRERLQQFESMYVARYWDILDRLSLTAVHGSPSGRLLEEDEKAVRSYIRLSEDELEMRKNGYVSDSTYALWADGLRAQFDQPPFDKFGKEILALPEHSKLAPYYVRKLLESHCAGCYDPLDKLILWRIIRGLAGFSDLTRRVSRRNHRHVDVPIAQVSNNLSDSLHGQGNSRGPDSQPGGTANVPRP